MASSTITFGMVAIPVKFYLAASPEQVAFNQFTASGHRVKQKLVDDTTGEEVDRDALSKGYEYAKGQYVTFGKDELQALELAGDKTVSIEKCVLASEIDLFQVEKTYYLGPDKGGDRAYGFLVETLAETGKVAIAQWGQRGREHLVAIRSYRGGLLLHALYYADEIRPQEEVTAQVAKFTTSDREKALARLLVEQMTESGFDLGVYKDRYRERVLAAVDAKVAGREIVIPAAQAAPQIVDLFEALKRSIKGQEAVVEAPAVEATLAKGKKGRGKRAA
jgi:DNA end-binding protein Ku